MGLDEWGTSVKEGGAGRVGYFSQGGWGWTSGVLQSGRVGLDELGTSVREGGAGRVGYFSQEGGAGRSGLAALALSTLGLVRGGVSRDVGTGTDRYRPGRATAMDYADRGLWPQQCSNGQCGQTGPAVRRIDC